MHYERMSAEEAKERSVMHTGGCFCISLGHLYSLIKDEAYTGSSNCYIAVPEEFLHECKKDLKSRGFRVFSKPLIKKEFEGIANNIFSRYPAYSDIYELEIEWH